MTDELAAIRAEKAFVKLSPAERDQVLAALFETQRQIALEKQYDRYIDRKQRILNRIALKAHLTRILTILDDPVGGFDAMDWLTDHHHRCNMTGAMHELVAFHATAQALLDCAKNPHLEPDVGRQGRGEMQLDADLTRQAFYQLIAVLESVDVRIGATAGKSGGPGARLLVRLIVHAVGFEVGLETVKKLVQQRRRSK